MNQDVKLDSVITSLKNEVNKILKEASEKDQAVKALIKEASKKKISESCLDEYVHDICSRQASEVNNGGINEQIKFIINQEGPEAAKAIQELFKEEE